MNREPTLRDASAQLALAAAYRHPDSPVRNRLRSKIPAWLERLRPRHSCREVAERLASVRGTRVEPFVLEEWALDLAALFAAACLSETVDQPFVRIVGHHSVGVSGGCLIGKDLRRSYQRRLPAPTKRAEAVPFLAPHALTMAEGAPKSSLPVSAWFVADKKGLEVMLPLHVSENSEEIWAKRVQRFSGIFGEPAGLDRLGLVVSVYDGHLRIRTGSPESLLRLGTRAATGATLRVTAYKRKGIDEAIYVRLRPPGPGRTLLPAAKVSAVSSDYPWCNAPLPPMDLESDLRFALAQWICPCEDWIPELLEHWT